MKTYKNKKMPKGVKKCFALEKGRKIRLVNPKAKAEKKAN